MFPGRVSYGGRMPRAPLPVRAGLNPSRVRLPESGPWPTTLDYLRQRFYGDGQRLAEKVAAAEVVDAAGTPVDEQTPFVADSFVFLYRDPAPEVRVPFELEILFADEHLLVVDKPHFLATTPRGGYIVESATVRLRRDRDEPDLSPVHRLDRVTAGVLIFSRRPAERGAYQELFARRQVQKSYEAVAPFDPGRVFPLEVASRIVKERGTPTAQEIPGEPNSHTRIELLGVRGALARYGLHPNTGRTHQLRVHLNSLGLPIRFDPFYPRLLDVAPTDYSRPLQLLARSVRLSDPLTGQDREFVSRRTLSEWPADTGAR